MQSSISYCSHTISAIGFIFYDFHEDLKLGFASKVGFHDYFFVKLQTTELVPIYPCQLLNWNLFRISSLDSHELMQLYMVRYVGFFLKIKNNIMAVSNKFIVLP